MASTTSENRKCNEKKSTEQKEVHFVSRVTVTLTREKLASFLMKPIGETSNIFVKRKRERDYLLNLHTSQSVCFGT